MSRGPGRVMHAALTELDQYGSATAYGVAVRAAHDGACGCDDDPLCRDGYGPPTRTQLVSARRALRRIADLRDDVELERVSGDGWIPHPPLLAIKRCHPRRSASEGNTYVQRQLGIREVDRCDSCARSFAEVYIATSYFGAVGQIPAPDQDTYRVQGLALCSDCKAGVTDAFALASGGTFTVNRMQPLPCAACAGQLSPAGLRRIYIDGATLPLCDTCWRQHSDQRIDAALGPGAATRLRES